MERENFYILLELEFNPPENDVDKIKKRIKKKQTEWSKQINNSKTKRKFQHYLDMVKDIKTVMLDKGQRWEEAKAAKKAFEEKKYKELDEAIALVSNKGEFFEEQLQELCKRFSFSEEEVRKRIRVDIVENKTKKKPGPMLDTTIYKQITIGLGHVEKKSLYEFLECEDTDKVEKLLLITQNKENEIRSDKNRTVIHRASLELFGYCSSVFKSKDMKEKYDASLANQKLEELNKDIDIVGSGAGNIVVGDFETLLKRAGDMGMTQEEAEEHILEYCKEKNWKVCAPKRKQREEKQKKCGKCGFMNPIETKKCTYCKTPFEVKCPKCKNFTPSAHTNCTSCGFFIAGMAKALPLIEQAKKDTANGDFKGAIDLFNEALSFWPNHPEAQILLDDIRAMESTIASMIKKANAARASGDLKEAAALLNKVLLICPNHPESLTILEELKERETKISQLNIQFNAHNPGMHCGISKVIIGLMGIVLSLIALITLIKSIVNLINDKSYIGNEPYLAAILITLAISCAIVGWGLITLISGCKDIKGCPTPIPPEFEIYGDFEYALVKKQIQPDETALEYVTRKDKSFIKGFLVFMGIVIALIIAKNFLPDEFFWNLGLSPQYFSFPLLITIVLAVVAVLRLAFIYYHDPTENRAIKIGAESKSIKSETDPETFAPGIKKKLALIQANGRHNMTYYSGINDTGNKPNKNGKIHGKFFIETHPMFYPSILPFFKYLYLFFAVILTSIGFFLITQLPPDNISVLTVPTIALGYMWSIIKGGLLVYSGIGLMRSISHVSGIRVFKSVIVYVDISGEKDRRTYDFKVFYAALWTEMNRLKENRQITKMTTEQESENAKKLVIDTIESFND